MAASQTFVSLPPSDDEGAVTEICTTDHTGTEVRIDLSSELTTEDPFVIRVLTDHPRVAKKSGKARGPAATGSADPTSGKDA